jgi:hypothetical protein
MNWIKECFVTPYFEMNILNWIYNKLFGCKCDSWGYGECVKCGKKYKRVKSS